MRRKLLAGGMILLGLLVYWTSRDIPVAETYQMAEYYITQAEAVTGAQNAVTAIYLFFRYYDTLFEALMLMVSIVGVLYLSVHGEV